MSDKSLKKENGDKNAVLRPWLMVAIVIGSLFAVETVIMNFFHELADMANGAMDSLMLTAVVLPLTYFLIYRPFSKSVRDLKALSGDLERQVREKTVRLEFSEALHRAVIMSSSDAIVLIDGNGKLLMANPATHWMLGYSKTELENRHISDILHDDHDRVLVDGYVASLDGWDGHTAAPTVEATAVTKSGAKLTVECSSSECLVNSEISFVIVMRDVSTRKKAEMKILEAEARFRQLSDASFEGIVITVEGKFVDANNAFARMFGYTPNEILGKTPLDLASPESHAIVMEHLNKGIEGPSYEANGVKKDGSTFPVEIQGRNMFYHGKNARVTAIRDITERKRNEELLRESEQKFMRFFMMVPIALGVVNKDGIITEFNTRFTEVLGYTIDDIPTIKEWWERAYPDESYRLWVLKTWGNAVDKAAKEGTEIEPIEYKVTCKNGKERLVKVGGIVLNSNVLATFVDVTEEKKAAEALRVAKEAAEAATVLKDKFVSLMGHDLKSPLGTMLGLLKLTRSEYGEPLNDDTKRIVDGAIDSGTQMFDLINDLLTLSRFKTGQMKLHKHFFDAKYLGAKMISDYSHLALQKGIEMENAIPENSRIYADRRLLTEAVQNLVTNAVKFCRNGDRITISLAEGDATTICIRDTGAGMKRDMLDKVFKYEEQTSTPGTAGELGTGLGLPLVKDIMEFHGGEVGGDCEPGKGCLFSLKLPYVQPTILIVDDDRSFRLLLIKRLMTMKVTVIEAENGQDALSLMASVQPHLVVTDIMMPVMDGLELLKHMKGAPNIQDIPVIVVSGEYGMDIRDEVFKLGADDFVIKGKIDFADFLSRVRRFVG